MKRKPKYQSVKKKFMSGAQSFSQEEVRALLAEIDTLKQMLWYLEDKIIKGKT
jgi:hypothetical protein